MSRKKAFPLRLDADVYEAIRRWAEDELRSANGQIEFLLTRALRDAGRSPKRKQPADGRRSTRTPRS